MKQSRFNHLAPIEDRGYGLYNFYTGKYVFLDFLSRDYYDHPELYPDSHPQVRKLRENGFLVDYDELVYLESMVRLECGRSDIVRFSICPTLSCNFACPYCFETARSGKMSPEVQEDVIRFAGQLWKFYLYPTFNCPLRCPYCYAEGGERKVKELPPADFLRITQEAVDAGYRSVVLVGGEPLVYFGFSEYLDGLFLLEKKSCKFVLRTSFAFPVKEGLLKKICAAFDEIVVSLDGDEETNDSFRGNGSFQHTVANVERALDLGGSVSISAVMTAEQGNGVPGAFLRSFCSERNISKLVLNSPVPMGRAEGTKVPYYEWRSDMKQSEEILPKYSCGIGHSLYMQPDGSVFPCYAWCEKEHQLGDLSRESLQEILDRREILSIINSGVDTNEKCSSCEIRYFCGGRCKIWVRNHTDLNSGDFDCEAMKKSILEILNRYGIPDACGKAAKA